MQCSSQKILLEGESGPYNPFLGARFFKNRPIFRYLSFYAKEKKQLGSLVNLNGSLFKADVERSFLYTIE